MGSAVTVAGTGVAGDNGDAAVLGTARQLTEGAFDHDGVAWTADGSEILVSANRHENADLVPGDSEVYAVDVATGAIRALTKRFGPDSDPAASPDGKFIAYTGFDDAYQGYQRARLYLMRRDNGEIRELAPDLDRERRGGYIAASRSNSARRSGVKTNSGPSGSVWRSERCQRSVPYGIAG